MAAHQRATVLIGGMCLPSQPLERSVPLVGSNHSAAHSKPQAETKTGMAIATVAIANIRFPSTPDAPTAKKATNEAPPSHQRYG